MSLARAAMHLPSWHERAKRQTQGAYLSALRGRGMEYDESRPYQAGDDIRTLDWRVTARSGKPHTKLFREERERPVYVCCDLGKTMRFATQGSFKSVVAARAAALISWKAQQSGDRIGGVLFDEQAHLELAPARGKAAVARLLKGLVAHGAQLTKAPAGQAEARAYSLNQALERLQRLVKPGSLIFVISDFRQLEFDPHAKTGGAALLARIARHSDTFLLSITDPLELAAPQLSGRCQVSDGRNKLSLTFGDRKSGEAYKAAYESRREQLNAFCRSNQIRLENVMTNDEPLMGIERLLR
ncbi:MAG: DUF58 domain-containing protein [Gammaproteobacteria bacterium]